MYDVAGGRDSSVRHGSTGHVDTAPVTALADAVADAVDGAGPLACTLGPCTERLDGQWVGVPAHGLDDIAADVFGATSAIVPVTHPQPFRVDIRWAVEQVVLVADRSSPHGPRLVDLVGVPLASTPSACRRADP